MSLKVYLLLFIFVVGFSSGISYEFQWIKSFVNYMNETFGKGEFIQIQSTLSDELGDSVGICENNFLFRIAFMDRTMCEWDDYYILHLLPPSHSSEPPLKPPVMVKCLQPDPLANVTIYQNRLIMMSSTHEITELLKPIGTAKHRHTPGSCVLVFFYSPSCPSCAQVAPYVNLLPALFPTLRVAAINADEYPNYNTEYGIIGLPTLMLFHQGRAIVKFYSDMGTFAKFVTRHTGINPTLPVPRKTDLTGPLPVQPIEQRDYILWLAWSFVILCGVNYFTKTELWQWIADCIKRNWRESEEQLEQNPVN